MKKRPRIRVAIDFGQVMVHGRGTVTPQAMKILVVEGPLEIVDGPDGRVDYLETGDTWTVSLAPRTVTIS